MDAFDIYESKALAERVAAGPQLTASPRLRSFFLYVVDCAIRNSPEEATEQQIGVRVFGRRPGYSSGEDSIVRSQARLLRMKLSAYFANEGAEELLVIEIPKGHYLPVFHDRAPLPQSALQSATLSRSVASELVEQSPIEAEETLDISASLVRPVSSLPIASSAQSNHETRHGFIARGWFGLIAFFLAVSLALGAGYVAGNQPNLRQSKQLPQASDALWSPFLARQAATLVIYSNPVFRGDPTTGLHLLGTETTGSDSEPTDDTYTGTGEVGSIYQLTRFFDARDSTFTLKRSRLVTWDEARSRNLIFIGASSQNTALHDLPNLSEFSIVIDAKNHGYVVNQHPRPGEPTHFAPQDKAQETAIAASLPGLEPGTRILIFSGLTTIGTQAAVEYFCRPENTAALARQAGVVNGQIRPFEAVLHVTISKGVGISTELLLVHPH